MEENILCSLVNYLQKIDFIDTGNRVLLQQSSLTAGTPDVSNKKIIIFIHLFFCVMMLSLLNDQEKYEKMRTKRATDLQFLTIDRRFQMVQSNEQNQELSLF